MSKFKIILFHVLSLLLFYISLYIFISLPGTQYFWSIFSGIMLGNHLSVLFLSIFYKRKEK